jgi:hypothetical protein
MLPFRNKFQKTIKNPSNFNGEAYFFGNYFFGMDFFGIENFGK